MTNVSRRGFLKSLAALGAGLIIEPAIEPLIVEPPRQKIWQVGAQLESRTTVKARDGWVIVQSDITPEEQQIIANMVGHETTKLLNERLTKAVWEILGVPEDAFKGWAAS